MSDSFSQVVCWQTDRIGAVINKEALSVDRADFLATHVPMRQIAYERVPVATSASEGDLLAELHHQADTNQHTFMVIKGVPGTGKSHLIRWLKERYAAERPQDAVLLIERANTSLRGTLQQIINSGLFDRAGLPESLKRLQEAVTELSTDALADNLLDQIKTATLEVDFPALPNRLKPENIYRFLLDVVIREQLKSPEGPIERIAAFLTHGREDNSGADETPGFEADDFVFKPDLLRKLNGYPEAKKVADDLQYKDELREILARYLNYLLRGYAISRATRLSTQDLREMFNELRQHLRKLDLQLALFIEDITAFTGIDEGLMDVLITQHHSESNRSYCRLTSVIGVTDAYFSDYMPDNFKDRATHLLTLSSNTSRGGSDLMQDETVRAEFAARYLNAMRMERTVLDQWVRSGASLESMPIACDECRFRAPCHAAFGAVEIGEGSEKRQIGVYPFNRRALDNLYRGLRESYPRTPRTYLFDLLGYVLQSHTEKIKTDEFPPPETELAPAVQPPSFNPAAHRQIVERQGGAAAKRLMTLLLYWGDRSAGRVGENLGSLSETVFRSFHVKMVEGSAGEPVIESVPTAIETGQPAPPAVSEEVDRYTRLIDTWMTSGKLSGYDKFGEWIADLIRSFIDWQTHGISVEQVKEYITQGRFEIEGQTGTPQRRHRLFFARTPELRYVLQALADLNTNRQGLSPAQYGEHLTTLSIWLRTEESRIVAFVREPSGLTPPPDYLLNIVSRNVVLLACLAGELALTDDVTAQYQQVIKSCAENKQWEDSLARMRATQPDTWIKLMRDVNHQDAVSHCRKAVLQLLNRPQGQREAVRYVDAASLLNILEEFAAADWVLPEMTEIPDTTDPTWTSALIVYKALQKSFSAVVEACYAELDSLHSSLIIALGEETPGQMMEAMQNALGGLRTVGISYAPRLDEPFNKDKGSSRWMPGSFEPLLAKITAALQCETLQARALYSGGGYASEVPMLRQRTHTLQMFEQEMQKKNEILEKKIEDLSAKTEVAQGYQRVISQYEELNSRLDEIMRGSDD
ncbi:MAG: ATP-binding protein [Chloroflexota bacterium]